VPGTAPTGAVSGYFCDGNTEWDSTLDANGPSPVVNGNMLAGFQVYPDYLNDVNLLGCPSDPDSLKQFLAGPHPLTTATAAPANCSIVDARIDAANLANFMLPIADNAAATLGIKPGTWTAALLDYSYIYADKAFNYAWADSQVNNVVLPKLYMGTPDTGANGDAAANQDSNGTVVDLSWALRDDKIRIDAWDVDEAMVVGLNGAGYATTHDDSNKSVPWRDGNRTTIMRLREGVERFLFTDVSNPTLSALSQSDVAVMWDTAQGMGGTGSKTSFNHMPGGANVLFMDGHVEFSNIKDVPSYGSRFWMLSDDFINFGRWY
jgi:prepilin-type processing-associated H-X9-DG protein